MNRFGINRRPQFYRESGPRIVIVRREHHFAARSEGAQIPARGSTQIIHAHYSRVVPCVVVHQQRNSRSNLFPRINQLIKTHLNTLFHSKLSSLMRRRMLKTGFKNIPAALKKDAE
jgi:hypothetical protein